MQCFIRQKEFNLTKKKAKKFIQENSGSTNEGYNVLWRFKFKWINELEISNVFFVELTLSNRVASSSEAIQFYDEIETQG